MQPSGAVEEPRPLTPIERELTAWMIENSGQADRDIDLQQLERASVVARCPCGCASVDFAIDGTLPPPVGLALIGDYEVGHGEEQYGIFVFEQGGALAGVEVYAHAADPPSVLPQPAELRGLNEALPDIDMPSANTKKWLHRLTTWDALFQIGTVIGLSTVALVLILTDSCSGQGT